MRHPITSASGRPQEPLPSTTARDDEHALPRPHVLIHRADTEAPVSRKDTK